MRYRGFVLCPQHEHQRSDQEETANKEGSILQTHGLLLPVCYSPATTDSRTTQKSSCLFPPGGSELSVDILVMRFSIVTRDKQIACRPNRTRITVLRCFTSRWETKRRPRDNSTTRGGRLSPRSKRTWGRRFGRRVCREPWAALSEGIGYRRIQRVGSPLRDARAARVRLRHLGCGQLPPSI
jgi:hypothetical protein